MEHEKLMDLLNRYRRGIATDDEIKLLESWYLIESAKESDLSRKEVEEAERMMSAKLRQYLTPVAVKAIYPHKKMTSWFAAAAIFCVIFSGFYFFYPFSPSTGEQIGYRSDIAPGRNGATLTLSDGRKIILVDAPKGELARESGVRIRKSSDGLIEYIIPDQKASDLNDINILSTAKGETYRVRLPDGTAVWLNAASSLKFPVSFDTKKSRTVQLSGEAYFEVSEDKSRPFLVSTEDQQVKVLGTHFNVSSYKDEPNTRTTLLEGSVQISPLKFSGDTKWILKPGQSSILQSGSIKISNANTEEAIAWKNGDFVFKNENIESIMRKLSRWYNIEVSYEGDVSDLMFIGAVSRSKNISTVLKVMESTGTIHFDIEGRRVKITR